MARGSDDLLEVQRAVAERGLGFVRGRGERVRELVGPLDDPHAFPASSRRRLQQDREPDSRRGLLEVGERACLVRTRHERDARGAHLPLGGALVAEPLHHVGGRPDEDEVVLEARAGEGRVLGEKAIPGMDCLAAGGDCRGDHARDAEVALRRRRRPDAHRVVGEPDVHRVAVGSRVHGDRLDPELVRRADHANGDLAPVGDEDAREHARMP